MNKYQVTLDSIKPFYKKNIDIYLSPPIHYRMRCEFSYKKKKYVMYDKNNKFILMDEFCLASKPIFKIQKKLLDIINTNEKLSKNLFQIKFRSNNENKILVSLIYRKPLIDDLITHLDELSNKLNISVNARSKKYFLRLRKKIFMKLLILIKKI